MNDSWVSVAFIVYLIAGSVYLLASPGGRLIARVQAQRPSWAEEMCVRFVVLGRIIFIAFTVIFTFFFLKQHLDSAK